MARETSSRPENFRWPSLQLTRDAILTLAPDAASAKAAQGLLNPSAWPSLGANERAVWGECQGSGAKPYQTQVDLSGPHFKCSCPSRKFPCKHGLALLLLRVEKPAQFKDDTSPDWVGEWLNTRAERERKREEGVNKTRANEGAAPEVGQDAAQRDLKRVAQRWQRIEQGAADLERWIGDLLRRGLATLAPGKLDDWHTMAARLVDAQAPGLGQRLNQAAAIVGQSSNWAERVLHRVGLLVLALHAVRRRSELPVGVQADLRSVVGWPVDKADVVTQGESVEGDWLVLGSAVEERENNLVERRVWLHGVGNGRRALLLDHAFGGRGFEHLWVVGSVARAKVAFYPSAAPLRALVVDEVASQPPATPPTPNNTDEWRAVGEQFAACPWTPVLPVVLREVTIAKAGAGLQAWVEGEVFDLVVQPQDVWPLLSIGGGHTVGLMAEWDGEQLRPLTVWQPAFGAVRWQRSVLQ